MHGPLNNKPPTTGTNKWRKMGLFRLYPPRTIAGDARLAAITEPTDRRSTLSLQARITLLSASQDFLEGQSWDKLFRKVSGRVYREMKISLSKFVIVKVPNHSPQLKQHLQTRMRRTFGESSGLPMAGQFYGCRIEVLPIQSPTVSQLLSTISVNYTPTSLYNTLPIGCHCGKSQLSTPHRLQHIIMPPHQPPGHDNGPWTPTLGVAPMHVQHYLPLPRTLLRNGCTVSDRWLNKIPGANKLQNVETATDLASEAWDDAAEGMRFGDHRCMPNYIRQLKNRQACMRFVKVDKNPGTSWLICEVLWASQLLDHFAASLQYNIILQCDTIDQAKWELLTMIDEARTEMTMPHKWRQLTKRLPSFRAIPPSGIMFPKGKSREWEGLLKMRLVISDFKHRSAT